MQRAQQLLERVAPEGSAVERERAARASLKQQIARLERVFSQLGHPVKGVTCQAIEGIIAESKEVMNEIADPQVLDAGLLSSAQAVEHYEITRYGTLIALAKQLGHADSVALLEQTLAEEKATDGKLTALAESRINRQAA